MLVLIAILGCKSPSVNTGAAGPLDTIETAEALAQQGMDMWNPEHLLLDWIPTVWAFGLHRLYAATGDTEYQDYYRTWLDDALADFSADEFHSSDSMSPAILAATLMLEDGSTDYTTITDAADAYLAVLPTTSEGAYVHWGPDNPWGMPHDQVWVDSQFMIGMYLLRMAELTGDSAYARAWEQQYEAFSVHCRDPVDQLYRHAWDETGGVNIPEEAVYWARGNSWVLVSAAEARAAGITEAVDPAFGDHAEAVLGLQESEDGLWHTVLNQPLGDDPLNYTETSAAALVAYAWMRGLDGGSLQGEAWESSVTRAVTGVTERVTDSGSGVLVVEGTSTGTNPGQYDDYVSVATIDDLMLGVGAVVMVLAEADGRAAVP